MVCAEVESEAKVFLAVIFIFVRGFMMIGVRAPDDSRDSFGFAHADRRDQILKPYRIRPRHVGSDRGRIVPAYVRLAA